MAQISGQKTVTAAGTEVALGSLHVNAPLIVKALTTNSGVMYVGNDGSNLVSSSTGFPLSAGEVAIFDYVGDLGDIMVDSQYNGEGVAWISLQV